MPKKTKLAEAEARIAKMAKPSHGGGKPAKRGHSAKLVKPPKY